MEELLNVSDLSLGFVDNNIVTQVTDRISFSVNRCESVGIVGESGCGKSVTALSIVRLLPAGSSRVLSGKIIFDNSDINSLQLDELRKIRGGKIGFIFQEPMTSLNPLMTIGEQLIEVLQIHKPLMSKEKMKETAIAIMSKTGIPEADSRYFSYPHELSGGMRQRIVICIALIANPQLIIADEPTTALDVTIQAQILKILGELKVEYKTSLLLITHNLGIIANTCDRVYILYAGRIVESCSKEQLFSNPKHPYTIGLIRSIPSIGDRNERLYNIKGQVSDPPNYRNGCRFLDRCDFAMDICKSDESPPSVEDSADHFVSCYHFTKPNQ